MPANDRDGFGGEFAIYAGRLALAHGVSAVSALVFVNLLTPADYGALAALTGLAAWVMCLATCGAAETFGRFLGLAEATGRGRIVGAWLLLLLASLGLLLALALAAANWLAASLLGAVALALPLALALAAQSLASFNEQLALMLRFAFRPFAYAGTQVFTAPCIGLVSLALLLAGFGLSGVLWAYLAAGLGTLAVLLLLNRGQLSSATPTGTSLRRCSRTESRKACRKRSAAFSNEHGAAAGGRQ